MTDFCLQKSKDSPLSGKTVGSLAVLDSTGGNSPLAEKRNIHHMNNAFFSVYAVVKWVSCWWSPNIWWLQKKMGSPHPIILFTAVYSSTVGVIAQTFTAFWRTLVGLYLPSLSSTFHWPLSYNILHVSINWFLRLTLSGHCLSVCAVSRRPTTAWPKLLTHRYSCRGGHPQRPWHLIGFPIKGKSHFRAGCSNASRQRRQHPSGSSLQILETKLFLI